MVWYGVECTTVLGFGLGSGFSNNGSFNRNIRYKQPTPSSNRKIDNELKSNKLASLSKSQIKPKRCALLPGPLPRKKRCKTYADKGRQAEKNKTKGAGSGQTRLYQSNKSKQSSQKQQTPTRCNQFPSFTP